jgi:roadblock/LC7 domain-containing protein
MVATLFAAVASAASLASPQIAYNDLGGNVYVASATGDSAAQVYTSDGTTALTTLALSADGKSILALAVGDTQQLVLLPVAGGDPTPVAGTDNADSGALSPDGKQVAFAVGGDAPGIYTVPVAGGTPKRVVVTPDGATDSLPRFSPDGKQLAFVRQSVDENFEATSTLELVAAAAGSTPQDLATGVTGTLSEGGALSFSPDGKTIAYAGDLGGPGIFTVSLAGGDPVQLTTDGDYWPSFSRDGASIVFSRDSTSSGAEASSDDDVYELWTVAADGSGEALVAEGDYESVVTQLPAPPGPPPSSGGGGSGSGAGSGSSGSGGSGTAAGKTATAVAVKKNGARYVVTWKGKASSWTVTLKVGKKKVAATVSGSVHSRAFTLHGAKGQASATVKGS